jgi:hypothetical protein
MTNIPIADVLATTTGSQAVLDRIQTPRCLTRPALWFYTVQAKSKIGLIVSGAVFLPFSPVKYDCSSINT